MDDLEVIQDLVIELGNEYDKMSDIGKLTYITLCERLELDLIPWTRH